MRHWAGPDGRVLLVDKQSGSANVTATRKALAVSHFNSVRMPDGDHDDLEREWSRLEGEAFPVIAEVLDGTRPVDDARAVLELKVLAAIHVVRSLSARAIHDRILDEIAPEFAATHIDSEDLRAAWQRDLGQEPTLEELHQLTVEMVAEHRYRNDLFVERQVWIYNKIITELENRHVQPFVAGTSRVQFVLGDVAAFPVEGLRVGIHNGVGALTAREIRMSISPDLAIAVGKVPERLAVLDAVDTMRWNQVVWRCAHRFLITSPGADWRRATLAR